MKELILEELAKEYEKKFRYTIGKMLNFLLRRSNPYKVYYAFLSQTGTNAPVPVVYKNDFLGTITYTYDATGTYTGTSSVPGIFTSGKSYIRWSGNEYNVSALNNIMTVFGSDFNDTSSFFISVGTADANGSRDVANGELHHLIEIIVFD